MLVVSLKPSVSSAVGRGNQVGMSVYRAGENSVSFVCCDVGSCCFRGEPFLLFVLISFRALAPTESASQQKQGRWSLW